MTEPVKFPYSDFEAPVMIRASVMSSGSVLYEADWKPEHFDAAPDYCEEGVKYLRADTATPNDQVEAMMRECVEISVYRDVDADAVIAGVLSRYVSN